MTTINTSLLPQQVWSAIWPHKNLCWHIDWGSKEARRKGWKSWSRLPLKCRRKRPLTPGIPLRLACHASCFRLISFWFEFFCSTHPQVNHCRVWEKKNKHWLFFSFCNYLNWHTAKPQNAHPSAKPGQNCSSPVTLTLQLARFLIYTQKIWFTLRFCLCALLKSLGKAFL